MQNVCGWVKYPETHGMQTGSHNVIEERGSIVVVVVVVVGIVAFLSTTKTYLMARAD